MADQGHTTVLCNFTTLLDIAAARPDVSFFGLCENNLNLVMMGSAIKVTDSDEAVCPFSKSTNTLEHYQSSERIP
jgi:hypothetical protein